MNTSFMSIGQTENVFKDYQIEWQKIQALRCGSVTLKIGHGFFFAINYASSSGKSTRLNRSSADFVNCPGISGDSIF